MMSQEQAMAFIQRVNQDEPLRSRIGGLSSNLNALLAVAAETGYTFTAAEWGTAIQQAQSEQLSESDLDGVAGGATAAPGTSWYMPFAPGTLAGFLCDERNLGGIKSKS